MDDSLIIAMIKLYAIITNGKPMEMYVHRPNQKKLMENLIKLALKTIQNNVSKFVKSTKIQNYQIYYFEQDAFIFFLATQITDRAMRMQNYLRVVADIFYENYDEKKFYIVLDRIMMEINRIEFGNKGVNHSMLMSQQQNEGLIRRTFHEDKKLINQMLAKTEKQSRRAYIISTILFLCIFALGVYYISKKWS